MIIKYVQAQNYIFDFFSGASFAEALGMCTMPQPSKKRHNNSPNPISSKSIKTERLSPPVSNKKTPTVKSEPEYGESSNVICTFCYLISSTIVKEKKC